MITITKTPNFISTSKNPITVTLANNVVGDHTSYLRIYSVADKNIKLAGATKVNPILIQELTKFSKTQAVSYDISSILHSQFTEWTTAFAHYILWKDEKSYFGYYVEYGEISYSPTQQLVYTKRGETNVTWCLRGYADINTGIDEYTVLFRDDPAFPLTYNPEGNETTRNQLINYPFLMTLPAGQETGYGVQLLANLSFDNGTSIKSKVINSSPLQSGGVYNYTLIPSSLVADPRDLLRLNSFSLWVEWIAFTGSGGGSGGGSPQPPSYSFVGTATRTATCPAGYSGTSVTRSATATSNVSQADADQQAAIQADQAASTALVCLLVYTATKYATAACAAGSTGANVTKSATKTSTVSQDDANQLATAAAQAAAQAALVCTAVTYSFQASYTATCPAGYVGVDYTATATYTSTISFDDAELHANQQAKDMAEANIKCELEDPFYYCHYYDNGCFSGQMVNSQGLSRQCTKDEGHGCWIEYGGQDYCGINPY